ncbi:MAG: hypothetical protein GY854_00145, partial [Deltaproteobacteria bacterium]|nr:hypothetical protein [Deltaproteobacteria bacterium]
RRGARVGQRQVRGTGCHRTDRREDPGREEEGLDGFPCRALGEGFQRWEAVDQLEMLAEQGERPQAGELLGGEARGTELGEREVEQVDELLSRQRHGGSSSWRGGRVRGSGDSFRMSTRSPTVLSSRRLRRIAAVAGPDQTRSRNNAAAPFSDARRSSSANSQSARTRPAPQRMLSFGWR